jgi:Carboxypeptidase regulatory-like domain
MTSLPPLLLVLGAASLFPEQEGGAIAGKISSPAGEPLPGVVVMLSNESASDEKPRLGVTDGAGEFSFSPLPPGSYRLLATLSGYEDATVEGIQVERAQTARVAVTLELRRFSESVVVRDVTPISEPVEPARPVEITLDKLDLLPLSTDQFQDAFPLLPGVVRDPEGRLSFNGARPSQSILLVNGSNVTDPVTGDFAVNLPLRAIETVRVNEIPYSAEYGRVTAAVAEVETRRGTDKWKLDTGDLIPRLNFRDGTIKGIRSFVPQVGISGPISKGKLWLSQSVAYRFVRARTYDVTYGADESIVQSYDSFTQLDWRMAENHSLTTTFSWFPQQVDNLGLNALTTSDATPDFESSGWNAALSERSALGAATIETSVAVKKFDLSLRPKSEEASSLTPDGLRDNYFDLIDRQSSRFELSSSITRPVNGSWGRHQFKVGANLSRTRFDGTDRGLPVNVVDAGGQPLLRIDWVGDAEISGSDLQFSWFAQDRWRSSDRLGIEVGLRYDFDSLVGRHHLAPRFALAYALDPGGRAVVRGGVGVFYDYVPLSAGSFGHMQNRVETSFGADGSPSGPPLVFRDRVADTLDIPRSTAWSAELDELLTPGLELRLGYRERHGSDEMIVDRLEEEGQGTLLLSSRGESLSSELSATLRVSTSSRSELFFAYAKLTSTGDLNHFATIYRNLRTPLLYPNETSLLDLDVPNRILVWGVWRLPRDFQVAPGVEWRSGFPYTVTDPQYRPVGERNRGGRLPSFFSFDVRVTKGLRVKGRNVRVGVQVYNLGSHYNPRDVVTNQGSARFGQLLNSVDMGIGLRLTLGK